MLPPEFWQGVEQFNQRQFYACHDTLEAIWIEAGEPDKKFYQGVLQVAVGLYHLGNDNWRGAVILLGEGVTVCRATLQTMRVLTWKISWSRRSLYSGSFRKQEQNRWKL
jgi:hypothetical protein